MEDDLNNDFRRIFSLYYGPTWWTECQSSQICIIYCFFKISIFGVKFDDLISNHVYCLLFCSCRCIKNIKWKDWEYPWNGLSQIGHDKSGQKLAKVFVTVAFAAVLDREAEKKHSTDDFRIMFDSIQLIYDRTRYMWRFPRPSSSFK